MCFDGHMWCTDRAADHDVDDALCPACGFSCCIWGDSAAWALFIAVVTLVAAVALCILWALYWPGSGWWTIFIVVVLMLLLVALLALMVYGCRASRRNQAAGTASKPHQPTTAQQQAALMRGPPPPTFAQSVYNSQPAGMYNGAPVPLQPTQPNPAPRDDYPRGGVNVESKQEPVRVVIENHNHNHHYYGSRDERGYDHRSNPPHDRRSGRDVQQQRHDHHRNDRDRRGKHRHGDDRVSHAGRAGRSHDKSYGDRRADGGWVGHGRDKSHRHYGASSTSGASGTRQSQPKSDRENSGRRGRVALHGHKYDAPRQLSSGDESERFCRDVPGAASANSAPTRYQSYPPNSAAHATTQAPQPFSKRATATGAAAQTSKAAQQPRPIELRDKTGAPPPPPSYDDLAYSVVAPKRNSSSTSDV